MNKMLRGILIAMLATTLVSGFSFADTTATGTLPQAPPDGAIGRIENRIEQLEERKEDLEAMKDMTDEERLAALETQLEDETLTDEASERIQNMIDALEEKIAFDAEMEDLLEDLTDAQKVAALEDYLEDNDVNERRTEQINRMIERYTIGEDVMDEIKAALDAAERGEQLSAIETLIDSGDYDDEALAYLEAMQERMTEAAAVRAEMDEINELLKGLTAEERETKIAELIEAGDYSEATLTQLEKRAKAIDNRPSGDNMPPRDGGMRGGVKPSSDTTETE
ncbi:MAG: hypothetical protein JXO44_09465 [Clostridia bacterium]|nr:hypothetical protein [Clostridia bacterium]